MLKSFLSGAGPTEARRSIRESLRIFREIEGHLEKRRTSGEHSALAFESLIVANADTTKLAKQQEPSCGHTSQCFASLFFSREQIEANHIIRYTNGSEVDQLWDNWNLVIFGYYWRQWGFPATSTCTQMAAQLLRARATQKAFALSAFLLDDNCPKDLPRVIFCNFTWVVLDAKATTSGDVEEIVKDHQWVIIKHSNDHFQLVQGYLNGYCLSRWQEKRQLYASRHGFSSTHMAAFLDRLQHVCRSPLFDAQSYQSLFGVLHQESYGKEVWPSLSFRELNDDSIVGYGDRVVARKVHEGILRI